MSKFQKSFENYRSQKISHQGPKKVKKRPKNQVNIKSQNLRNYKNESCSPKRVDPRTVFEPYSNPKSSPIGLQKVKNNQKITSNSKELKES